MSKFNYNKIGGPTGTNYMGSAAYVLSDKEQLVSLVMTTFLQDSYYMSENEIVNRIIELADKVGYEFVAKLAIYARTVGNMRSVSHLLASHVCKDSSHQEWLKNFYEKIVVRPDDMSEILCCYAGRNGIDIAKSSFKKIPNSMKKGFRKALEKLSPYQIDKYKMNNKGVSLIDLVNLFHPTPTQKNAEAYRCLMHGESLDHTYDGKILEKEMSAAGQEDGDIELAKHDAIVSVLKAGMPIMNLLRNLRNIMLYAHDAIDDAIAQLTNPDKIRHSKLLPFRFASAYDAVKGMTICDYATSEMKSTEIAFESDMPKMTVERFVELQTKVLSAIEVAMTIACENVPDLGGNCAILIDHSGSVRGDCHNSSTVSPFSSVHTAMIGNIFGSIMAYKQKNVYIGMFGDKLISAKMDRNSGLLKFNSDSYALGRMCGASTENGLYEFLKKVIAEKKHIDNLIVFSDMEIGRGGEGGWDRTSYIKKPFQTLFKEFRKINPECLTVCVNINNRSGTAMFNPALRVLNIAGWSNAIFDTIAMYQNGKIKSMTEEIEKISL